MAFSEIELTKIIKNAVKEATCNQPQSSVFRACDAGGGGTPVFIRSVFKNGSWVFYDSSGNVVVEGVDFDACT